MLRHVAKYLKGTPEVTLVHRKSYPGKSFRYAQESEEGERDPYAKESLLEVISDSDWAADRESRQSVSCGAIMLNGNLIHLQSKRQKCVSLSSCEAETVAATSILSEAVFLRSLLTRILGKEPRMRLYSNSSSSRQLIARKGLGKAIHLDVDLLWIQRIEDLVIKPIKGKDNPADLGTKSLTRDKIRKYMVTIGYVGDYLAEGEPVETSEADVRMAQGRRRYDEGRLQRIIQAVTMAVLIGLGEAHKANGEEYGEDDQRPGLSMCMIAIAGMLCVSICRTLFTAAVLLKSRVEKKVGRKKGRGIEKERENKRRNKEKREKTREKKMSDEKKTTTLQFADSGEMTEEEYIAEIKRQIREEAKSIESVTILEDWLKKAKLEKYEDPRKILKVVKELNRCREDAATPEKRKESSEAGSDPSSSSSDDSEDEEKEEKATSSVRPEDAERRKDELKKKLTEQMAEKPDDLQHFDNVVTEQAKQMDKRANELLELQQSAKRRRRKLATKAKASKPSESSSSGESEKEEEKKEEQKESGGRLEEPVAAEQPEEPKEAEKVAEVEMAKEPEKEVMQTPDEAKEDDKLEEEKGEEGEEVDPANMSVAGVCRDKYHLSEDAIEMLLEQDKQDSVRAALEMLENSVEDSPLFFLETT